MEEIHQKIKFVSDPFSLKLQSFHFAQEKRQCTPPYCDDLLVTLLKELQR